MKEYRFTLNNTTQGSLILEYIPDGWLPDGVKYVRNMKYMGLFRKLTVNELKFPRDGREYIIDVYDLERTQGIISIAIDQLNKTTFLYENIYTGILDLTTYLKDDIFVSVQAIDTSFTEKVKSREDISVDLRSLKTIEDVAITPFSDETPMLVLPDIYSVKSASWTAPGGSQTATTHMIPLNIGATDFTEGRDQTLVQEMFNASTAIRTITVSGTIVGVGTGTGGNYDVYLRTVSGAPQSINIYSDLLIGGTSNVNASFSEEITIAVGDDVKIEAVMTAGIDINYSVLTTALFTEVVEDITGGEIDAYPIYEAFLRTLQIITGGANPFKSTLFGRTDTPLTTYPSDGELTHITKGLFIRGLTDNNTMPVSITDMFASMNAIFNIGLGVETIGGVEKVVVEELEYFFDSNVIIDYSDRVDPDNIVIEVAPDYIYNSVLVGYNKYEYEQSQGLLEFNTKTEYTTIINNIKNVLNLISEFRADSRGIKNLRVTGDVSDDQRGDDDVFVVATERDGADFDALTDQDYDKVAGGFDAGQSFNLDYSPGRNVRRHGGKIRSALELYTSSKMKWQYNQKNSELVTRKTGELVDLIEKADILISALDESLWIPEIITVEVPFIKNDLDAVEDNPKGIIKLATGIYGWILELNSKSEGRTADLRLLRVNTDNVTPTE